jgi:hypothetical protein
MMRKIISNGTDHDLKDDKFPKSNTFVCTSCAIRKLILRPSPLKIHAEPLSKEIFVAPYNHYVVLLDTSWF